MHTFTRTVHTSAVRELAAAAVLRRIERDLPSRLESFVESCLGRFGCAPLLDIAGSLGIHRATLARYCEEEGFPPPTETRVWCRLMLAAYLLESTRRNASVVARELGVPCAVGVEEALAHIRDGDVLELDAGAGTVTIEPSGLGSFFGSGMGWPLLSTGR